MPHPPENRAQTRPDDTSAATCQLNAKRAQILQGAETVFLTNGYEGASMSQIAREAGVSKGTLYNHFDSKASLFSAFFEDQSRTKLEKLEEIFVDDGQDIKTVLLRVTEACIRLLLHSTNTNLYRILIGEAAKFPNLADTFYRYGFARTCGTISKWLLRHHNAGNLSVPDPDFAAEQFMILCQTRIIHRRRFMLPVDDSDDAIRQLAILTTDAILKIYAPIHQ